MRKISRSGNIFTVNDDDWALINLPSLQVSKIRMAEVGCGSNLPEKMRLRNGRLGWV